MAKAKPRRSWLVPYRATVEGTTVVEAHTADEAREQVERGVFDLDAAQSIVDWEARGRVEPNE